METLKFSDLVGKTLTSIVNTGDTVEIETADGEHYRLYHSSDCCESVSVDDVVGDLADLVGSPIMTAEEVSSVGEDPEEVKDHARTKESYRESFTWTFYKLATIKGSVTIRWYGESNGYYSESVDFIKVS